MAKLNEFYWTYIVRGEIVDDEYSTKKEAQSAADDWYYYRCTDNVTMNPSSLSINLILCRDTYFGDRVILKIESSEVHFDVGSFMGNHEHYTYPAPHAYI